ncbi:hypothetical protein KSF_109210 [Reticulibacter mediterranei]|uniref:Uncharacterized protein n=1 Tax=Reticulibacter mediterranei TaxID=2778369 RepID=A0A8J3IYK4_9CHLR|nr:hypothetical protein [Reticulibacter mediterranei]GHP00874.1 hypothetical protein KSF_109210 [Reticulibacter mediterranei]
METTLAGIGAICFGLVVGWISYRTLRRKEGVAALSDIAAVISAIGGAAVTALFRSELLFGLYAIGLALGFFAYFLVSISVYGKKETGRWMGE